MQDKTLDTFATNPSRLVKLRDLASTTLPHLRNYQDLHPKKQGRAMVHYASDTMRHSNVDLDHAAHYKKGWNDPNQEP